MESKTCTNCRSVFTVERGFFSSPMYECGACRQIEAMENMAQESRRAAQEQAQWQARENAELQRHLYEAAARQSRFETEEMFKLEKLKSETKISSSDAYEYGLHYIENDYKSGQNNCGLHISIAESGGLVINWVPPYINGHLNQAFQKGLREGLNIRGLSQTHMLNAAYWAGKQMATGNFGSGFKLHTNNLKIGHHSIDTASFDANFSNEINEDTGEIIFRWSHPFKSEGLNNEFARGVNDYSKEANGAEEKANRLKNIVAPNKIARKKAEDEVAEQKSKENINALIGCSIALVSIAFPVLWLAYAWQWLDGVEYFKYFSYGVLCGVVCIVSGAMFVTDNIGGRNFHLYRGGVGLAVFSVMCCAWPYVWGHYSGWTLFFWPMVSSGVCCASLFFAKCP